MKGEMNMKRTTLLKMGAIFAAVSMLAGGTSVFAAGTDYSGTIGGTKTTTFDKYLVMDADANVPNASFTYAITAGTAKAAGDGTLAILAGVDADKVTMSGVDTSSANTIAYTSNDSTSKDVNTLVKNYDNTTEKYAKKTATLDFSACAFTEPGIYRYIITESGTNQAITNDELLTRVVDVYVQDASDGDGKKLEVAGYVLHTSESDMKADGTDPDGKSQGFTNEYDTSDLTFRKEVSGNQASRDKYFEYTVEISGAVAGTVYDVDLTNADATSGTNAATIDANKSKTNPTSITVDENGTATAKFYLQHGQEIKICGIAKNTTYNVTENKEDYTSTAAGVTNYTDSTNGKVASTDIKTSYLNERAGVIPTGVIMTVAPFVLVTLLAVAGMVIIKSHRRKAGNE